MSLVYLDNSREWCRVTAALLLAVGVGACSSGGSTPPPTLPAPPAGVNAVTPGPRTIQLTWTHPGDNVDVFHIERRSIGPLGPNAFRDHATLDAAARVYTDDDLEPSTQYDYRMRACRVTLCSAYSNMVSASTENPARAFGDRPDEISGPQIRVMYVLPSDGGDRAFDTDGTLARSVASFHAWFQQRTGGYTLRFDTHGGNLDIGFHRLSFDEATIAAKGAFVVSEIDRVMREAGLLAGNKIYLVYYDGTSTYACGGAAWPPSVPGQVAAMYLKGRPNGGNCGAGFVLSPTSPPFYWEFAALHDLLHTFGIVSRSAPHHQNEYPAHVPEQNDLMFSGPGGWIIDGSTLIDVGNDDYFGDDLASGLPSLDTSPYVAPPPVTIVAPRVLQREMNVLEAAALRDLFRRLPMHPPFPR